MDMEQFLEYLKNRNACIDAIWFCKKFSTPQKAWDACENSDWMFWLLRRTLPNPTPEQHKSLVRIACEAARLALPAVKFGELQPLRAIEAAEAWLCGRATGKVVAAAAKAAACAADAAYAAADATYAAAYDAAYAAAHAAYACAHTANAAVYHTANAAAYEADVAVSRQIASIIRRYFPDVVMWTLKNKS